MPVPIPMGLIELTRLVGEPASLLITNFIGAVDIGLMTAAYCPIIISLLLYQLDKGHHRIITYLSVTVPFALLLIQDAVKSVMGINTVLNIGLAPILAIFIACMAIFKNRISLKPRVLMTIISASVWLISHFMFYIIESCILKPGLSQISGTMYAWSAAIDSATLGSLCEKDSISCLPAATIDTRSYQAGMQKIYARPLVVASSLVSLVWVVGLLFVLLFHRRKKHV